MFCPKCKKEYTEGIYLCRDCRISLVPQLQPEPLSKPQECSEFEEILFTSHAGEMALIKSLFESEGITYYFKGEFSSHAHPFPQPTRVMLKEQLPRSWHKISEVTMSRRILDLSIHLENDVISDPPPFRPRIHYMDHDMTFSQMASFFPGLKKEDLPEGAAWAVEKVELTTHNGTHLDAPYHFHPTMDRGERAITIDEVNLDWCFQPGVKLDFRRFADGYVVTAKDVETELERIRHPLRPLEIVLINTRAGSRYGQADYVTSGCGMGHEATIYLLERGVRITGTDAWSWDPPFIFTARRYAETHDPNIIWEGHKVGRHKGYCHLEKLHHLEALPAHGFMVACFPVKIRGGSAGWTRAVAIIDDELMKAAVAPIKP